MSNYTFSSFWLKPQAFRTSRGPSFFAPDMPAYLASINQSAGPRKWPLKTLPWLKGASTHVIMTSYDLPNRLTQPYDVIGTPDGTIWFSDFGQQFLGRLDPKTGRVTTFPVLEFKPGYLDGSLDPTTGKFKIIATPTANSHPRRGRIDERTGILWFAEFGANRIGSYDTKADNRTITEYLMPTPSDNPYDAQLWVGANHEDAIIKVEALP
jgi:streptogramin lyase